MKKQLAALGAAFLMTACTGAAILMVGGAAMFNKSGVPAANSPAQAPKVADANPLQPAQVRQLQDLVSQYQSREQDYQARENQYQQALSQTQSQLQQAQQQIQQFQLLLVALQQRGLITITGGSGSAGGGD